MQFPRFTAKTAPRGSGVARANDIGALTRTSDPEFYRSIGAIGQGLNIASDYAFRANQQRRAVDADLQYKKASADVYEYTEKYMRSMEQTPITSDGQRSEFHQNYMKQLEEMNNQRNKEIDNPDALNARKSSWPHEKLRHSKDMYSYLTGKLHFHQKGAVESIGESFIKEGRIDEAKEHFQYHIDKGLITQADADKFMAEKETYYEARNILAEKGYDASNKYVMSQDIDVDIKKKIISDIYFEASQQEIAKKQQLEQKETEYLLALTQEQLSQNDLDNDLATGAITPDLYKEYTNYIKAQQQERLRGKPETDWDTWSNLRDQVDDYKAETRTKETVTNEISKAIKDGKITISQGISLREKLDDGKPQYSAAAKRGFETLTELKTLHKSVIKDLDESVQREEILKMRAREYDFEQWLEEEPRTDDEVEKKIKRLSAPIQEEITLNWFERLIAGYDKKSWLAPFSPGEEQALVKKKVKALQDKGLWDDLSETEQKDIKAGFEKGASVQDVLDLMNAD